MLYRYPWFWKNMAASYVMGSSLTWVLLWRKILHCVFIWAGPWALTSTFSASTWTFWIRHRSTNCLAHVVPILLCGSRYYASAPQQQTVGICASKADEVSEDCLQNSLSAAAAYWKQSPSRGCVFKTASHAAEDAYLKQPPSRGCVFKTASQQRMRI